MSFRTHFHDVFISYSRSDSSRAAERLYDLLHEADVAPAMDTRNLALGDEWHPQLDMLLQHSAKLIFLVSEASTRSEACRRELDLAEAAGLAIILVRLDDTPRDDLPPQVRNLQYIRLSSEADWAAHLDRIVQAIRQDLPWEKEKLFYSELAARGGRLSSRGELRGLKDWMGARPAGSALIPPALLELERRSRTHILWRRVFGAGAALALVGAGVFAFDRIGVQAAQERETAQAKLIGQARAFLAEGRHTEALVAALQAWPSKEDPADLQVPDALPAVMAEAVRGQNEVARIPGNWKKAAASADFSRLILLDEDNQIHVYNTTDWTREGQIAAKIGRAEVTDFVASPDGRFVALATHPPLYQDDGPDPKLTGTGKSAVHLVKLSDGSVQNWFLDWTLVSMSSFRELTFDPDGGHFGYLYPGGAAIFALDANGIARPVAEDNPFLTSEFLGGWPTSMTFQKDGPGVAFIIDPGGRPGVVRLASAKEVPGDPLLLPEDWGSRSIRVDNSLTKIWSIFEMEGATEMAPLVGFESISFLDLMFQGKSEASRLDRLLFGQSGVRRTRQYEIPSAEFIAFAGDMLEIRTKSWRETILRDVSDPETDLGRLPLSGDLDILHVGKRHAVTRGFKPDGLTIHRIRRQDILTHTGETPHDMAWTGPGELAWASAEFSGVATPDETTRSKFDPPPELYYQGSENVKILPRSGLVLYRGTDGRIHLRDPAGKSPPRSLDTDLLAEFSGQGEEIGQDLLGLTDGPEADLFRLVHLDPDGMAVAAPAVPVPMDNRSFLGTFEDALLLVSYGGTENEQAHILPVRPDGTLATPPLTLPAEDIGTVDWLYYDLRGRHQVLMEGAIVDIASGEVLWSYYGWSPAIAPSSRQLAVARDGAIHVEGVPFDSAPLPEVACSMLPVTPGTQTLTVPDLPAKDRICPAKPRLTAAMQRHADLWETIERHIAE